jgi:hypothetical protein
LVTGATDRHVEDDAVEDDMRTPHSAAWRYAALRSLIAILLISFGILGSGRLVGERRQNASERNTGRRGDFSPTS